MPDWLEVQQIKAIFFLTLYYSINDMKLIRIFSLHLSRATAIFVVDCCKFGPSWMFGLKTELMACAEIVGGTSEKSCIFNDLI